jgi:chromate transporter
MHAAARWRKPLNPKPDTAPERPAPTRLELLLGFMKVGLLGFGGVAPLARHIIVEERRWLDEAEYARTIGICQVMPGANTVNAAVMIGDRFAGPSGAAIAVCGVMGPPLVITAGLALAYGAWGDIPAVKSMLQAVAATGSGLVLGTALRLARASPRRLSAAVAILGAAIGVGIFRVALPTAVAGVGALAVAVAWLELRRAR